MDTEAIILKAGEAALVLRADDTIDILVPEVDMKDGDASKATPSAILAVSLAHLVATGDAKVFSSIDHVERVSEMLEAEELAEAERFADEGDTDDTIPGKD